MRHCLLGTVLCLGIASAQAATFTVTNLADSGAGSLRAQIAAANASPGADTIDFQAGLTGTIVLTSGQLQITDALTITGPGAASLTIDGNANNRIFLIEEAAPPACPALTGPSDYLVTISGLTLTNAHRNTDNTGGAIWAGKSLVVDSLVVHDNAAKGGAGISFQTQYAGQSLTIANSTFTNNLAKPLSAVTSNQQGGALRIGENCGTGVINTAIPVTVTITNSVFTGNRAQPVALSGQGGAIYSFAYADITITDTRIVGNHVDVPNPPVAGQGYQGGAIRGFVKSLTIQRSEISGNSVDDVTFSDQTRSGAFHLFNTELGLQNPAGVSPVKIIDSTVSDNSVGATGGAMVVVGNIALELDNTTVSANQAFPNRTGGILLSTNATNPPSASNATPPTLTMSSSIVARSMETTADISTNVALMPSFTINADHSLIQTLCSSCNITVAGAGNKVGIDPLFGPLAFNGGPTQTRSLQIGSPAIGAGANPLGLATDQRGTGYPRTQGTATDMGAYEYAYPPDCVGFTDVAGSNSFCPSVDWLKNRAITSGCSLIPLLYCPNDPVTRVQMAKFMNNLGNALTGQLLVAQTPTHTGALDTDTAPIVCVTGDFTATAFARRGLFDAVFSAIAASDAGVNVNAAVSEDGGATWQDANFFNDKAHVRAGQWHNFRIHASGDLPVGVTLRLGLQVRHGSGGTNLLTDSFCNVRVRFEHINGRSAD